MRLRSRCPGFYRFAYVVLCGCLCVLTCQGCGALGQRSAVRVMGYVAETGMPAYLRETDLELAEPALATSVKLTEALLETAPDDTHLLLQAVQGLAGYTYAFVEVRVAAAPYTFGLESDMEDMYQLALQGEAALRNEIEARYN